MTSKFAGKTPFIVVVDLLAATPLAAQTMEKAARDQIATVADTDPNMATAMRKAQATLADFFKIAASPGPGHAGFLY